MIGLSSREIRNSPRARAHGTHIFGAIEQVIRTLDDEEFTKELINYLERDHRIRTPNLKKEHFQVSYIFEAERLP